MKAKNNSSATVQKWTSRLVELVFPRTCFFCKTPETLLCADCRSLCEISPVHSRRSGKHIADCYAPCAYDNRFVKRLISSFKYEPFSRQLAEPLAGLISAHLTLIDDKPDFSNFIIVPVPLSERRRRWRGYNQAQELAKVLAKILDIDCDPGCLARNKKTACQVGLSAKQRLLNVAGAFSCPNPKKAALKRILLVDDVITTGATVEECARTLTNNGAEEVIALAIARERVGDT